jgi:hypothetical protein
MANVNFKDYLVKVIKETSPIAKEYRGLKVDKFIVKDSSVWGGTIDYLVFCHAGNQALVWEVSIWESDGQAIASFEGSIEYYRQCQKELNRKVEV